MPWQVAGSDPGLTVQGAEREQMGGDGCECILAAGDWEIEFDH